MAEVVAAGVVRLWEILVRFDGRFMCFSLFPLSLHLFTFLRNRISEPFASRMKKEVS